MERLIKVKLFFSSDLKTKFIFIEAFLYLGLAYLLLRRPFKRVAPKLGVEALETSIDTEKKNIKVLKNVSNGIQIMSRYTFWDSKCLVQAIAGMKMLERRQIDSTLYLGTARDEEGKMIAHAWLRSGSFYVTGKEVKSRFTIVNRFAKQIGSVNKGERNE